MTTVDPDFVDLVSQIVSTHNPQYRVGDEPGEAELARVVGRFLTERCIKHEIDCSWGVHAVLTGPDGPGAPGVLLAAHLDSDHLGTAPLNMVLDNNVLRSAQGQEVGLDCKTGVAIALSVLDRLRASQLAGAWQVHVLFTVGEESGQKGAFRAPLPRLLAGNVRYGIVIDRMTSGSNCPTAADGSPVRHLVSEYKGVNLLEPCSRDDLLHHLNAAHASVEPDQAKLMAGRLPLVVSPNCADAIELRGRWDAEIVAPTVTQPSMALREAVRQYESASAVIAEALKTCAPEKRVGSMNAPPRLTRYQAMRKVYDALYGSHAEYEKRLAFSVVNLSYDYDDARAECDLLELDRTARIVLETCKVSIRRTR